jgi:hypothetical protein
MLGHTSAAMSLRYARLFDSTVRTDYERALAQAKTRLTVPSPGGQAMLPVTDITGGNADWKDTPLMRSDGYSTLEELEAHYTGGDQPMSPLTYVWYQYRWQRLAAKIFNADGEDGLVRLGNFFHGTNQPCRMVLDQPSYRGNTRSGPRTASIPVAVRLGPTSAETASEVGQDHLRVRTCGGRCRGDHG